MPCAENGAEALTLIFTGQVDLVLRDLDLPVINGQQLLEHMSKRGLLKTIPAIIISGQPDWEFQRGSQRPEALATFTKPYDLEKLLQVVARALEGQEPPHNAIALLRQ